MRTKPIHVLLVEDNPADADLTKETLETSKLQLDVSLVVDGEAALDYLFKRAPYENVETPDLILLDLDLPKVDGHRVLRETRTDSRLRRIPVVVLSSSEAEIDIARTYEVGASCYVTKPVGLKEFQAIVKAVEGFWFTVVKLP